MKEPDKSLRKPLRKGIALIRWFEKAHEILFALLTPYPRFTTFQKEIPTVGGLQPPPQDLKAVMARSLQFQNFDLTE